MYNQNDNYPGNKYLINREINLNNYKGLNSHNTEFKKVPCISNLVVDFTECGKECIEKGIFENSVKVLWL